MLKPSFVEKVVAVNVRALDNPPPVPGLKTVTLAEFAEATLAAGTCAEMATPVPYVVTRSVPSQRTTELGTKFVPAMTSWKAALPAGAEGGVSEVMVGAEFIVNVWPADVPPPGSGLKTVTAAVPAVAILAAGTTAESDVDVPKVVTRSAPFQRTMEPATKFEPATTNGNDGPPAPADDGAMPLSTGTGFVTGAALNVTATVLLLPAIADPEPGAFVRAVTFTVPAEVDVKATPCCPPGQVMEATAEGAAPPLPTSW